MKALLVVLALGFSFARAEDKIGQSSGSNEAAVSAPSAKIEETEFGGDDLEMASEKPYRGKLPTGHSWRNTQIILKGMKKIRCRKGGASPKQVALPALASEGYCNKMNDGKQPADYPVGTVWVYGNGEYGNTAVKLKEGSYFTNHLMSAPPPSRGKLIGIMVPGCGKKERKCERSGKIMRDLKRLEKARSDEKGKRAEEGGSIQTQDGAAVDDDFAQASMYPSDAQLKAEDACEAHTSAFRDPTGFVECMNRELAK